MPGFPRLKDRYDFLIAGGGHAGLQAGLKAALLGFTAAVFDRGPKYSRSYYAPSMANIPGFPEGVSGHELLDRQIAAARRHEAALGYFSPARVVAAAREDGLFRLEFDWLGQRREARGRALILAMGVVDRMPVVAGGIDPIFPWANLGLVHFCVLCDGHDIRGKRVGVLGHQRFAARTALELRTFAPASLELLLHGGSFLDDAGAEERARLDAELRAAGIPVIGPEIVGFDGLRDRQFHVKLADGTVRQYDRGFSGLGWYDQHAELPVALGCRRDPEGYVVTDEDGRALGAQDGAPIPGLYCVGDLRNGWNQIPEAWAMAERAVIHAWAELL